MPITLIPTPSPRDWPKLPYKGLRPYGPADRQIFFGRDRAVKDCAQLLSVSATRVLILHGTTGSGKSSLLRAGLIPHIESWGRFQFAKENGEARALFVQSTATPMMRLAEAVYQLTKSKVVLETPVGTEEIDLGLARLGQTDASAYTNCADVEPSRFIDSLSILSDLLPQTLVLILDQAEQMLTLEPGPEGAHGRDRFRQFLDQFIRSKVDIKLVISVRTDQFGRLMDELQLPTSNAARVRDYLLPEITVRNIPELIEAPQLLEHYGFTYAHNVVQAMAADLQNTTLAGGILAGMQIVCDRLYRQGKKQARRLGKSRWQISVTDYKKLGGLEGQVIAYIRDVLQELCKAGKLRWCLIDQEVHRWLLVLKSLAQPQVDGTVTTLLKPLRFLSDEATRRCCRLPVEETINELAQTERRILVKVADYDSSTPETSARYCLGHDVIGLALTKWPSQSVWSRRARFAIAIAILLFAVTAGLIVVQIRDWYRHRLQSLPARVTIPSDLPADFGPRDWRTEEIVHWATDIKSKSRGDIDYFNTESHVERPSMLMNPILVGVDIMEDYRCFDLSNWQPVEIPEALKTQAVEPAVFTRKLMIRKTLLNSPVHLRLQVRTGGFQVWWLRDRESDVLRRSRKVENMPETDVETSELDIDLTHLGEDGQPFVVTAHAVIWNCFQDQQLAAEPLKAWDWAATRIDTGTGQACLVIILPPNKICQVAKVSKSRIGDKEMLRSDIGPLDHIDSGRPMIYRYFKDPEPGFIYAVRWQWTDRWMLATQPGSDLRH